MPLLYIYRFCVFLSISEVEVVTSATINMDWSVSKFCFNLNDFDVHKNLNVMPFKESILLSPRTIPFNL